MVLTQKQIRRRHYLKNKDKILLNDKLRRKTAGRIKTRIISHWKLGGIIHNEGLYHLYDNIYIPTNNCNNCNIEFNSNGYNSRKCCDHNHSIVNSHNFRAILCHYCNVNGNETNTTGTPNIYRHGQRTAWKYARCKNKKTHSKYFKSYYSAIVYKWLYELGYSVETV